MLASQQQLSQHQQRCVRIHVPLDLVDTRANVFSFPRLLARLNNAQSTKPQKKKGETDDSKQSEVAAMDIDDDANDKDDDGEDDDDDEENEDDDDGDSAQKDASNEDVGAEDLLEKLDTKDNVNKDENDGEGGGDDDDGNEDENDQDSDSDSDSESDGAEGVETEVKKKRTRRDPTNVYDIDDAFIDDSDMLDSSTNTTKSSFNRDWPFGYFAWKGKVENFHEDIAFQDFFEAPRAPAPKRKRGFPVGEKKTILKKSADVSPTKGTAPGSPGASNLEEPGATSALYAVAEKKRKRASATGTPMKAKAGVVVAEGGASVEAGADSGAPTPAKKKKRAGSNAVATAIATGAPTTVIPPIALPTQGEDATGRQKEDGPLVTCNRSALSYLKAERDKESFENKKNFPQNLRPPLLEASKIALNHDELTENFIRHVKKVLPYNSFTLKRLIGRMMLNHAIMQSKIAVTVKTTEFEKLIKTLCAEQGIDGPQDPQPPTQPQDPTTTLPPLVEKKKFRFSEDSKLAIWNLLVLEWEQAELLNLLASMRPLPRQQNSLMQTREYSLYKRRVNTRAAAAGVTVDVGSVYIESVGNMLAEDRREVFRILKAMKALLVVPPNVKEEAGVGSGSGVEKKEGGEGDKKEGDAGAV
ncbi:hypothetical protein BCR33DRAFT_846860 [Rhizoclosmatium globosum]|uniref:Ubinuclein middle domain-containing protein n=1 Tax=Rhizoclosmatium globosum TaxID=329046 RepID=A0A1Y2CTS1_9FUNG|nr:hypothetical protein BCR33DRAFT_846860 [Rhizoclosmatium globosum]|eukprot:ORY50357.1 hypothetical protein BCR33DRAFT_846860 [Rhizoclosmatium globosum]